MTFLFGDASPSALESNFIDYLRDALDCAVKLLGADQRLKEGVARAEALKRAGEVEVERLEALRVTISQATEEARAGNESATARCADAIDRSAGELVLAEIARVRQNLEAELGRVDARAAEERSRARQAVEALLAKHDLPGAESVLSMVQEGGTHYRARLAMRAPFGLAADIELEVPPAHPMAHVLRVDKVVERLEVQAPEEGGWLRKEVKLRPQRLDREYVAELTVGPQEITLRLRTAADGSGVGFDVAVHKEPRGVRMVRVGEGDLPPFELAEVDAERVLFLADKLAELCAAIRPRRKALIEARLDDAPLRTVASPRALAERLVEALAPTVQEIARRSLSPGELVLKRQLGDGRREELFISKAELLRLLDPLPPADRALFAPLGLENGATAAPPPPPAAPPSRPPSIELEVSDAVEVRSRDVIEENEEEIA